MKTEYVAMRLEPKTDEQVERVRARLSERQPWGRRVSKADALRFLLHAGLEAVAEAEAESKASAA